MMKFYFSSLLKDSTKHRQAFQNILNTLEGSMTKIIYLKGTKDIWCRDYMPIRNSKGELIQFRYEPSYLKNYRYLQSDPRKVLEENGIKAKFNNINLDGGNVIMHGQKAIITNRVDSENPEYADKSRLFKEIEGLLEVELIVMPCYSQKKDMTGHIDGMMRWVDADTLIGNDLELEEDWLREGIKSVLAEHGLDYIPMPFYEDKSTSMSAMGIYVNYLELEDIILFPIFEQKEEIDNKAVEVIINAFPSKEIKLININSIAKEGGLINCVSW